MKRSFFIGLVTVLLVSGLGYLFFSKYESGVRDEARPTTRESFSTSSAARVENPLLQGKEQKVLIQKEGGAREMRLVKSRAEIAPLTVLKPVSSRDGFTLFTLNTIVAEQEVIFVLDEKTKMLSKTPIHPSLLIGQAGTDLFFFRSTRYGERSYRTELNEIVAFDMKTEKERQVEILSENLSYARQIQEGTHIPKGTALLKDGVIRAEVYFESAHLFSGEERLPVEIHSIPVGNLVR